MPGCKVDFTVKRAFRKGSFTRDPKIMTTANSIRSGKRYRRAVYGLIAIGMLGLSTGFLLDRSLPGLVVYAITVLPAVALTLYAQFASPVTLQDERGRELERRASNITFQLFGYLGLFAFVALLLLDATGRYGLTTRTTTLLYAYAVICLTWGGLYLVLRFRS